MITLKTNVVHSIFIDNRNQDDDDDDEAVGLIMDPQQQQQMLYRTRLERTTTKI